MVCLASPWLNVVGCRFKHLLVSTVLEICTSLGLTCMKRSARHGDVLPRCTCIDQSGAMTSWSKKRKVLVSNGPIKRGDYERNTPRRLHPLKPAAYMGATMLFVFS